MSLNGLDDAKVIEAHESALAEPGGWFLLKYASRDEVELLGKGTGGIVEIRNRIAQYEESSPLFGFLRYRRRSVLIKYVPEDCSRLIQARVSVHFTAFSERFSPHDTIFPIATSKELRDTSLSAACSLHTASGSTSSSTSSLRRRRLMEIAEDAEEDQRAKRQSTVHEESTKLPQLPSEENVPLANSRSLDIYNDPSLPSTPDSNQSSPTRTRRLSSQSVRPHMYSLSSYGTSNKPKIKLGPRPSLDQRAHSDEPYRPVSSLPAGLKLFRRGSKKQKPRPQTGDRSPGTFIPTTGKLSGTSEMRDSITRPHTSGGRPVTSSGASVRSDHSGPPIPTSTIASRTASATGTPSITPEKARLMKALQLRKKQMSSSSPEPVTQTPETVVDTQTSEHHYESVADSENRANRSSNAVETDSGIGSPTAYTANDLSSELTKTDSSPTSPVGTEHAASTKASSLSESTDETVQESTYQKDDVSMDEAMPEVIDESECGDTDVHTLSDVDEAAEDEAAGDEAGKEEAQKALVAKQPDQSSSQDLPIPDRPENIAADSGDEPNLHASGHQMEHDITQSSKQESVSEALEVTETEPSPIATPLEATSTEEEPKSINTTSVPEVETPVALVQTPPIGSEPLKEDTSASSTPSPTSSRDLKIPKSKFSVPNLRASDSANKEENTTPELPQIRNSFHGTGLLEEKDPARNARGHRRKTSQIDRVRTDISADISAANSDNEFLEDDDLMDELQSATFQEAKPISVAKSPMTQMFPLNARLNEANRVSRVLSNPLMKEDLRHKSMGPPEKVHIGRSVSAGDAFLSRMSQQQSATAAKKVNVGSGISQRIKALEKLSSSSPNPGTLTTNSPASPAFFSVRQASVRRSQTPSIMDRANSLSKTSPSLSRTPSISSPGNSPEVGILRDRAGSIQSRKETFNTDPSSRPKTTGSSQTLSRPETISVTARIIRDPNQPYPRLSEAGKDPSDYSPLDLKASPLIIDHQKAVTSSIQSATQDRRSSTEIKNERRSSMTIVKDLLTSPRRTSFSSSRRSTTIERSETSPQPDTSSSSNSRPPSLTSRRSSRGLGISLSLSPSAAREPTSPKPPLSGGNPKSENRGMKILRRMSSGFSTSKKALSNAVSPTIQETEPAASSKISQSSIISTDIGDVNVQFPDTLLWKRRHVVLDSQGFLILNPVQSGASNAMAGTKRYHMNDLRMPYIPDMDMQELPNSVSLDFVQGGGLQFACEDRAAQSHVLHVLEDAHRAWASNQIS